MNRVAETLRSRSVQEAAAHRRALVGGDRESFALAVLPSSVGDGVKVILALLLTRTIRQTSLGRS